MFYFKKKSKSNSLPTAHNREQLTDGFFIFITTLKNKIIKYFLLTRRHMHLDFYTQILFENQGATKPLS